MEVSVFLQEINEFGILSTVFRIFLAMFLGGLIGMERERSKRPAGFRTHILVCVGSAMTALIGLFVLYEMGADTDPTRISAQVISGVGFLGVGTILVKEHDHITGLTTAAGLWSTAAIGIACGYGFYVAALVGTFVVTLTSAILFKLEKGSRRKNSFRYLYLEIAGGEFVNEYTDWLLQEIKVKSVNIVAPRSDIKHHVGVEASLFYTEEEDVRIILEKIREKENVIFAIERLWRQ